MTDQPLLEGEHLRRSFTTGGGFLQPGRELRAVDDVTLALGEGETVALVGESGSGKSTLGRLLLGLLPPTGGTVRYRGRDVAALRGAEWRAFRREVQVVFQDSGSAFNPRRSLAASLSVPLRNNLGLSAGAARSRAAELLERVGLAPAAYLDRFPHELSGGQRQRAGIARAMASDPRVVVADEPVSALDVSVRAQVLRLLRDLQAERGVSYLFITHDLGVVRSIAHRVLVLYLGSLVESGPVAALFQSPGHPYTRALLASTPVPDPARRERLDGTRVPRGEIPSATHVPSGCRFHPRCPLAQPVCATTVPPMRAFADGVAAACHFADEVRQRGRGEEIPHAG